MNGTSKKTSFLIIILVILGILTFSFGTILNYILLHETILNEVAPSHVNDGEFLKVSHPVKIADFESTSNDEDNDGGFFIVTVKDHEYLIYKNNLSHRFGMTHYPDCHCQNKKE